MLETFAIVIGGLLILLGLAGSVLPILPGAPLSFAGLLLLAVATNFSPPLSSTLLILMAAVTVVVTLFDFLIPLLGAKRYGTSRWGIWGSVAGMMIGLFFPPYGIPLGALFGAVAGELFAGGGTRKAWRAAWGTFLGIVSGVVLRLAASGVMTYYFVRALLNITRISA